MELLVFTLGIFTSILGFYFVNYILFPIRQFNEQKAKIGRVIMYYSHIITSPGSGKLAAEAMPLIRELAVELEEKYLLIKVRSIFAYVGWIPSKRKAIESKNGLIFLSNSLGDRGDTDLNCRKLETIYTALDIDELNPNYNQKYQEAVDLRKLMMGEKYTPLKFDN